MFRPTIQFSERLTNVVEFKTEAAMNKALFVTGDSDEFEDAFKIALDAQALEKNVYWAHCGDGAVFIIAKDENEAITTAAHWDED